jgi:hypothetical protein
MDDSDIEERVNELDAAVTKNDAKLLIYYEEEGQSCEFIGNRNGYLRAGIEMLRAAITPLGPNEFITPLDLNYLIGQRSLIVKRMIRREDVEAALPPLRNNSWKTNAIGIGCMGIVIFGVICAFMGLDDVITWLFRK